MGERLLRDDPEAAASPAPAPAQDAPDDIGAPDILSAMGEAALLRDSSGAVLWVNRAFCALFGGTPDLWRGRDFGGPRARTDGARRRYEGETATRRGRRWIEWEETALPDGRILSIGRDITRRRAGEAAHAAARAEAGDATRAGAREEARQAKRLGQAFFAAVTHELRTPLNGVLGMAGLLEASDLTPNQAEHVAAIRESGAHLLAMINDVLDAARLEAGDLELEEGEVDCARLVRSVVELLAPKAFEKGIEIASLVDPALPARVLGDEGRLRQILFNLAGAAIRRDPPGGVIVAAHLDGVRDGRARIAFSVTDDGPALTEEARRAMVDPALAAEESAIGENAGLGLVVARRLVGAMRGDLEVDSRGGSGARIAARVALPVSEAAAPESGLEGRTVVVAAASPILRRALCAQAGMMGATAAPAASPEAALRAVQAAPGATLLADAAWRAELGPAVMAAAAAGLLLRPDQRGLIPQIAETGFDFYLMKPVRPASLSARLRGARAEEEIAAAPKGAGAVRGARILLAEDNRINALLASTMLTSEGCHVDVAANGQEALEAVQRARYDLVLMDVRMPVMDGLDATRAIRALGGRYRDLAIVALTANAFAEDRAACMAAGMNDFATKPIDMEGVARLLMLWTCGAKQAKLA